MKLWKNLEIVRTGYVKIFKNNIQQKDEKALKHSLNVKRVFLFIILYGSHPKYVGII